MAKRKKAKATKRKVTKKRVVVEREKILKYENREAGQKIWVMTVDGQITQAEILEFHPKDKICPAVSITMIPDVRYRVVPFDNCFETRKEAKELKARLKEAKAK